MLHIIIKNLLALILSLIALNFYLVKEARANAEFVEVADEINKSTKSNEEQNRQIVEEIQQTEKNYRNQNQDYNKTLVKNIEDNISKFIENDVKIANASEISETDVQETSITAKILNDYKLVHQATKGKHSCSASLKEGLKIFISFSMPKELLLNYDQIARKIGAKLIIRGLINNSFKETIDYIKELNEQGMMIDIDPRPFNEFKIDLVPSFVLSDSNHFDKLVGNVSVIYALEQFADSGETASLAKEYLNRLLAQLPQENGGN